MADKILSMIISSDSLLSREVQIRLASMAQVESMAITPSPYNRIREAAPKVLFLDIRKDPEECFKLARRVDRFMPATRVIMLSDSKDPDLILDSLKAGACDYLLLPLDPDEPGESVKALLDKEAKRQKEGDIFVLSSNKGGQGVTTLAVNLACHLEALTGQKVLLADLKLQSGDVALFMDVDNPYTVTDLLRDLPRLDENLLFSSIVRSPFGPYVLPAPGEVEKSIRITAEDIGRMFRILKENMDYIIVDVPHELTDLTAPVMDLSRQVLLVTQQTVPALRSVRETLDLFKGVGYETEKLAVILNRYEKNNEITLSEIESLFEQKALAVIANDFHAVTDAINKGRILSADHNESPANKDIRALACKLLGMAPEIEEKGLFQRLKGFFV